MPTGNITGNLKSTNDINADRYITANNNIRSKSNLQVGDGPGNIHSLSSENGWMKSHSPFYASSNFKTDGDIIQKDQIVDTNRIYDITLATNDYTNDKFYPIILTKSHIDIGM